MSPVRGLLLLLLAALGLGAGEDPRVVQLADAAILRAQEVSGRLPGVWTFKLVQPPSLPPLLGPGPLTVVGTHLSRRDPVGRFFVVLDLQLEGRRAGQVRVDLEGRWKGDLWRSREPLARRVVLEESMLEAVPFEGVPPDGALLEAPVGLRTKGPMASGHTLIQMDVEAVPLVQAGEKVKLVAEVEGLLITTEALARSSGALGERIRLEAIGTRKPIKAIVSGPAEARLL